MDLWREVLVLVVMGGGSGMCGGVSVVADLLCDGGFAWWW